MSQQSESSPPHALSAVIQRLSSLSDLSDRGIGGSSPDRGYALSAILLGRLGSSGNGSAIDVAVALEVMDRAILTHYYESARGDDVRLLAGDCHYARAMSLVAALRQPVLVGALAEATADIARGHGLSVEAQANWVLRLRSALFPAAVHLAGLLGAGENLGPVAGIAGTLGVAREAVLADLGNAADWLATAETALTRDAIHSPFGANQAYLLSLLRMWRSEVSS